MPDQRNKEQEDFELNENRPYYYDRPRGTGTPPPLRPDQMMLWVPPLEEFFVIPRWTADDIPAGWTLLTADIDAPCPTRTKAKAGPGAR